MKILAFDTEDDSKGNVFLINFYGDNTPHTTFKDVDSAILWLAKQKGSVHLWACNVQYDLANLFYHRPDMVEITYAGSRVISANIPSTKIFFKDTLNHWKMSVEEMGRRIGLPKLDHGNDFNNVEYCRRDTEIVYKFVKTMQLHYKSIGAKLKSTVGSTALDLYYSMNGIERPQKNVFEIEELKFMENAMVGGRTECFFNKPIKGNIWVYDFNSLYPSVMRDFKFPYLGKREFVKKLNLKNEGIAHVRIRTPNDLNIPYLPFRRDGTLCFPLGDFDLHCTYFEIRQALKLGYKITKTYSGLEFTAGTFSPFKNFVETLYKNRLEAQAKGDLLLSDTYKLVLNNLFGKFGQSNEKTRLVPLTKDLLLEHNCQILENKFVLIRDFGDYPSHTNYIWSIYVLAYARDRLYFEGINRVISDNSNVLLYCDTDSLFFKSGKKVFENSSELGELKLETKLKYAYFRGLKNYKLITQDNKTIYKVRGVPRKHAEEFFENMEVSYRKPYRLREVLRRNSSKIKKNSLTPNYWELITKKNKKIYDKRKVLKNGTTEPIKVS